jgi:hypothetical protein
MARSGVPNYRKLAFERYPPICVVCGFGIKDVLQVAHLDCDPQNCNLDNLAILCPNCHRQHDITLIPTEIVIRLRDEPRLARWSKLTKNAGQKAAETKRLTPGLNEQAAKKAVATRRAREAAANGASALIPSA